MTGVAIEQMLELWCVELRQVKADLQLPVCSSQRAASAAAFLDGLLGPERRKTGWMRAEAAGDPGPWRQQAVLGRSHWDADALRDMVRDYALETLASPGAVLVIDETGFLKQGQNSCGVGRQYTGSAGKIASCQIGVFAAYASDKGCAFIDRQLYLPKDWTDEARAPARGPRARSDPLRHQAPNRTPLMIERALAAGVPFEWVATDTIYGGSCEMLLRRPGKGYVLGVQPQTLQFLDRQSPRSRARLRRSQRGWSRDLAASRPAPAPRAQRLYDWAYFELADLEAEEYNERLAGLWTRGLLIRRSISDGELAFFSTWCPAGTPIETLVRVEGRRWAIEGTRIRRGPRNFGRGVVKWPHGDRPRQDRRGRPRPDVADAARWVPGLEELRLGCNRSALPEGFHLRSGQQGQVRRPHR